jgi:hypothetical protein
VVVGGLWNVRGSCEYIRVVLLRCGITVCILQAVLDLFRLRYVAGVLLQF